MAHIAIIVGDLFEDAELDTPLTTLREEPHRVDVVGVEAGRELTGKRGGVVTTDLGIGDVDASDYDALVIPGGYSPDKLRTNADMVAFVRAFAAADKPVAAICHAPWMLIEAGVATGRTVTSAPSLTTDLRNAGATWVDEEVVEDGNVITSRGPDDLPAFMRTIRAALAERS